MVIVSPCIVSHSNKDSDRKKDEEHTHSPFIGTIDEIGRELQILREIGVEQVVFSYHFLPEGKDVKKIIQISKELSLFAR
jgi:alkanesulfonate monooxygenase SsuD/methylene tetrahydromethanopterin reductase-like flavin-dependent oxidoreductase (luciferase family)